MPANPELVPICMHLTETLLEQLRWVQGQRVHLGIRARSIDELVEEMLWEAPHIRRAVKIRNVVRPNYPPSARMTGKASVEPAGERKSEKPITSQSGSAQRRRARRRS